MRSNLASTIVAFALAAPALPLRGQEGPIEDNSFLIEEAYNQERGVVQHISVLDRPRHGGDWSFDFTQEWPAPSQRHQLSYTIPLARVDDETGIGDVALNYRYQLVGVGGDGPLAIAPRLSVVLPTGDEDDGLGSGEPGLEVNLPVSYAISERLVGHWNLGATYTRAVADSLGREQDLEGVFAGQGLIWLATPTLNLMLEALWQRDRVVAERGGAVHEESLLLAPGVRYAQNLDALQVVYGLALPVEVGAGDGERSVLLYLSLEHPFRR
jgi:hypothetical protein